MLPVAGCGFLAYSCAAARELHPLPCLCHGAKTRKPKDISKNGKKWCEEFTGASRGSQLEMHLAGRSCPTSNDPAAGKTLNCAARPTDHGQHSVHLQSPA